MNRFLISIGLIIYISSLVNCYDLKIENICEEDIFTLPNGLKVNAISRHQISRTFDQRYRYFITENDFSKYFKTEEKANEANEIKESFNNIMNKIYSESNYLNDNQLFKNVKKDLILIEEILKKANNLQKHTKKNNDIFIRLYMLSSILNAHKLLLSLNRIRKNKWELNWNNFEILRDQINNLQGEIKYRNLDHLKYALEDVIDYEIFVNYRLIQKNKFTFNLSGKGNSLSTLTLVFDILLPLENKNYENKKECIKSNSLPDYYKNKK